MTLTTREKNMLFALAFISCAWIGSQYIIGPMIAKHEALQLEYDTLLQEQADIQVKLAQKDSVDNKIVEKGADIQGISNMFYDAEEADYFYDWVIDAAQQHNIEITAINFNSPSYDTVAPYYVAEETITYPLKEHKEVIDELLQDEEVEVTINESNDPAMAEDSEGDQVLKYSIQFSGTGTKQNLSNLIDMFSHEDRYTIIESYTINENEDGSATGQIDVSFYGVDKINGIQ